MWVFASVSSESSSFSSQQLCSFMSITSPSLNSSSCIPRSSQTVSMSMIPKASYLFYNSIYVQFKSCKLFVSVVNVSVIMYTYYLLTSSHYALLSPFSHVLITSNFTSTIIIFCFVLFRLVSAHSSLLANSLSVIQFCKSLSGFITERQGGNTNTCFLSVHEVKMDV